MEHILQAGKTQREKRGTPRTKLSLQKKEEGKVAGSGVFSPRKKGGRWKRRGERKAPHKISPGKKKRVCPVEAILPGTREKTPPEGGKKELV